MGVVIGQLAAGIIPEPAEMVEAAVRLIGPLGRRSQPQVVIEIGRRVRDGGLPPARIVVAGSASYPDHLEFAQHAAVDNLLGHLVARVMVPLRPHHHDALVLVLAWIIHLPSSMKTVSGFST